MFVRTMALLALLCMLFNANAAEAQKEDADATKLLEEARTARAEWNHFAGFSADLVVNVDGKVYRTPIKVSANGEVQLQIDDAEVDRFARRTLESLVGHRLASDRNTATPCTFADSDKHHPLGRAIQVLNDEFHSSYRIRDKQVIVVNRTVPGMRFTITVLANTLNKESKFLPSSYVVNYWDLEGEVLRKAVTHHHTWKRVGPFDLPQEAMILTATPKGQIAQKLTLKNHKLATPVGE